MNFLKLFLLFFCFSFMNNALAVDPEGDQSGSPGNCSICLMKMDGSFNPTTQLDCGHTFHQKCLNNWIRENPTMSSLPSGYCW